MRLRGVGGAARYAVHPAVLALWHADEARWQVLRLEVLVAPLMQATEMLPSVLGWDILESFRIELDWGERRIALLDRSDWQG